MRFEQDSMPTPWLEYNNTLRNYLKKHVRLGFKLGRAQFKDWTMEVWSSCTLEPTNTYIIVWITRNLVKCRTHTIVSKSVWSKDELVITEYANLSVCISCKQPPEAGKGNIRCQRTRGTSRGPTDNILRWSTQFFQVVPSRLVQPAKMNAKKKKNSLSSGWS